MPEAIFYLLKGGLYLQRAPKDHKVQEFREFGVESFRACGVVDSAAPYW